MSEKLLIRVKPGIVVKDPLNGLPLPADRNMKVDATQFWLRRLQQGDVLLGAHEVVEKKTIEQPAEEKKGFKKKKSAEKAE